jgi:hypothetical protein
MPKIPNALPLQPVDCPCNSDTELRLPEESLTWATAKFGTYLAVGIAWYVKPVTGPLALPLDRPKNKSVEQDKTLRLVRELQPATQSAWLHEKPFRLVLGAGFVGGLYRHLGLLLALEEVGLKPRDLVGVSAGAIVGSMYGTLPLRGDISVETSLMTLHPQDFLDPSWATLRKEGAVCPGHAFENKLRRTFAPSRKTDLSETNPHVSVEVYDTTTGVTSLLGGGPLVQSVRWSSSLPVLFSGGRFIDGGWIDQNGLLGMTPGERAINHRIYEGDGSRGWLEWRINRPSPVLEASTDSEHQTLHFPGDEKITEANFIFALQDKAKLERITAASKHAVMQWLASPATK